MKENLIKAKEIIENSGGDARIIAKIESQMGIDNIDEIIAEADGVMIGRAAVGHPEVFAEVLGERPNANKLEQIKFHYEKLMEFFPEKYVVKSLRAHLAGYLSGEYKNSKLLVELLKIEKYDEIIAKLGDFLA